MFFVCRATRHVVESRLRLCHRRGERGPSCFFETLALVAMLNAGAAEAVNTMLYAAEGTLGSS